MQERPDAVSRRGVEADSEPVRALYMSSCRDWEERASKTGGADGCGVCIAMASMNGWWSMDHSRAPSSHRTANSAVQLRPADGL